MKSNQIIKCFLLFAFLVNGLFLFSQPMITAVSPPKMYTQNESVLQGYGGTSVNLQIDGKNFRIDTITGYNYNERVKLFFKKGDKLERIRIQSADESRLFVSIITTDWFNNNTPIGIYIEVDEVRSNTFYLQVEDIPKLPPVITTAGPIKWTIGNASLIRISGKFLGEIRTTSVKINDVECSIGRTDYFSSYIDFYIPASLAETPGTYPIIVQSIFGKSNPVSLIIQKPLIVMVPVPQAATINPEVRDRSRFQKAVEKK